MDAAGRRAALPGVQHIGSNGVVLGKEPSTALAADAALNQVRRRRYDAADGATHAKVTRLPVRETMRRSVGAVPVPERTSSALDARPAPASFTARTRRS